MASEVANPAAVPPAKPQVSPTPRQAWLSWGGVPAFVFVLASVLFLTISAKNDWTAGVTRQLTDDAYLHADLTPLSTKVSRLVAKLNEFDDQNVKAGQLLVQLKDNDFLAQVAQAEAECAGNENSILAISHAEEGA